MQNAEPTPPDRGPASLNPESPNPNPQPPIRNLQSPIPVPQSSRGPGYVSRGGEKLATALEHFRIDPGGRTCADLGCNVGGFTDCLLQRGARKVYAVDTAYGELAWRLRKDARVVVMERTNALHLTLPEPVSLVVLDVGWTRQHLILPRARSLLAPGGCIVTLIKPHYEADKHLLRKGVLPDEHVEGVIQEVFKRVASAGIRIVDLVDSPIRGQGGNREVFGLVEGE